MLVAPTDPTWSAVQSSRCDEHSERRIEMAEARRVEHTQGDRRYTAKTGREKEEGERRTKEKRGKIE